MTTSISKSMTHACKLVYSTINLVAVGFNFSSDNGINFSSDSNTENR